MRIRISWDHGEVYGTLNETPTAGKVGAALPCSGQAHTWGKEVYFDVPVQAELEDDARQVVDPGTICFWVQGSALALPYGPTPVSVGEECRLVTEVNVLGAIEGDPALLDTIRDGDVIRVEAAT